MGVCQGLVTYCHLKIKSEPFLLDLKFKSEHLYNHNLRPKGGLRLWFKYIKNFQTVR